MYNFSLWEQTVGSDCSRHSFLIVSGGYSGGLLVRRCDFHVRVVQLSRLLEAEYLHFDKPFAVVLAFADDERGVSVAPVTDDGHDYHQLSMSKST